MAAKISENVSTLHHGLAYNDHKKKIRCIKTHLSNILKVPEFHLVRLPLKDKI